MLVSKKRSKERNWYRRSRSVSRGNQLLVQSKAKAKQGRTSLNRPTHIPLWMASGNPFSFSIWDPGLPSWPDPPKNLLCSSELCLCFASLPIKNILNFLCTWKMSQIVRVIGAVLITHSLTHLSERGHTPAKTCFCVNALMTSLLSELVVSVFRSRIKRGLAIAWLQGCLSEFWIEICPPSSNLDKTNIPQILTQLCDE